MVNFSELDPARFAGGVVILDIDGTLMPASGSGVPLPEKSIIEALKRQASVFLFSNRSDMERNTRIAASLGVPLIASPRRKPHPGVLQGVERTGKKVFVIGDKVLTDGLLALFTGAEFVQVKRISHSDDLFVDTAISLLDDIVGSCFRGVNAAIPFVRALRPFHWVKNGLVFAPLFFAGLFLEVGAVASVCIAFVSFCALASAVYVFNDIQDIEADRVHPVKRSRPIASGAVSIPAAYALSGVLGVISLLGILYVPSTFPAFLAYLVVNGAYSLGVKRIPFIELFAVASLYVLRVLAGAEAAHVPVSIWIVLCTFFGALLLITGKRYAEFEHGTRRVVLNKYSRPVLARIVIMAAVLAACSYIAWGIVSIGSVYVLYSSVFVVAALTRVSFLILFSGERAERPEALVFTDWIVSGSFVVWAALLLFTTYGV